MHLINLKKLKKFLKCPKIYTYQQKSVSIYCFHLIYKVEYQKNNNKIRDVRLNCPKFQTRKWVNINDESHKD